MGRGYGERAEQRAGGWKRAGLLALCGLLGLTELSRGALLPSARADERHAGAQGAVGEPLAHVREGWLRGQRSAGVERFLGIPYAMPPVGERRWRAPQAVAAWSGVRAAVVAPPSCPQAGTGIGEEDCLYLSVLRPAQPRRAGPLPVLFWIHGGGFKVGAALDNDPSRIVRETDTVVVMSNYRLGQLGFLAHPALIAEGAEAAESAGRFGFLDQQLALRWVHDNIGAFGGDPERVTLAGGSAGGISVCAHLASPAVAGLFSSAAIFSGSCFTAPLDEAVSVGLELAEAAGCPALGAAACLRSKSAAELASIDSFAFRSGIVWGGAVLPEPAVEAVRAGRAARVPLLIGGSEHETRVGDPARFPLAEADYEARVREAFGDLAPAVLERYPAQAHENPYYAEADVGADAGLALLGACINRDIAQAMSARAPVYVYEFADDTAPMPAWFAPSAPPGFELGASHGSDEIYWFDRPQESVRLDGTQRRLAGEMVRLLGRFLRKGSPSERSSRSWPRYDAERERVLRFVAGGTELSRRWAQAHHCDFWRSHGLGSTP